MLFQQESECADMSPHAGHHPRGETKPEKPPEEKEKKDLSAASDFDLYLMRVAKAESAKQVDDIVIEFFHDFNTKANRQRLAVGYSMVDCASKCPAYFSFWLWLGWQAHFYNVRSWQAARACSILPDGRHDGAVHQRHTSAAHVIGDANQNLLEQKVKVVKYLCELCKFKICPPGVTLCDDFNQQNAELCANLLQSCGRYLLYKPETAMRTDNLLERMARLAKAKSLPLRLEIMLEDAFYQVKPPEGKRKQKKEKDILCQANSMKGESRLYKEEDEDP
eukprot:s1065_g19.t1